MPPPKKAAGRVAVAARPASRERYDVTHGKLRYDGGQRSGRVPSTSSWDRSHGRHKGSGLAGNLCQTFCESSATFFGC